MITCCKCGKELVNNGTRLPFRVDNKGLVYCESCAPELFGTTSPSPAPEKKLMSPRKIKEKLDRYVIGQDAAKKVLATSAYNHFKRIGCRDSLPFIEKSNLMIIGPSGSGKTHLLKKLAEVLDVNICITNALTVTEAGYKGDDVSSLLERLITTCNGSTTEEKIQEAEKSILFIDEIDKLAAGSNEAKERVGGIGVQQALLPILEGTKAGVFNNRYTIDTTNILFIVGGAFPGLDKNNISTESLHEYGFSVEFLGRIPARVRLDALSVNDLLNVLTEPEDSIIRQYTELFALDRISLSFEDDALIEIARIAYNLGCGARGLRTVLEATLGEAEFMLPDSDVTSLRVTKDMVVTPAC